MDDLARSSADLAPLRAPSQVMRLDRMGASFPTRLSFLRTLMRRLRADRAQITRRLWDMSPEGVGRAVYTLTLGGHSYALIAFSHTLPPEARTDRVIAERWDATFALFDGLPTRDDLDRLEANVPLQEAGRLTARELVLSRANKSVRLFDHVVRALSQGQQPSAAHLAQTGYLMRTTAVYGNGKFGLADRAQIAGRAGLSVAFQVEMLTVWLIRTFTFDLVEHLAKAAAPDSAVPLADSHKRLLGIGNATGLGMAPFLVTHPELTHSWVAARETALARVRGLPRASAKDQARFDTVLARAIAHADSWDVPDPIQSARIMDLRKDLRDLHDLSQSGCLSGPNPWDALYLASGGYGLEAQECLIAALLEPHGAVIDDLAETMQTGPSARLDPKMTLGDLNAILRGAYAWALKIDFSQAPETQQFWYVSADKAEPRIGQRDTDPGAELETPLDIARQVQGLWHAIHDLTPEDRVDGLLRARPALRHILTRVQAVAQHPYGEIQDNLIGASCRPIDLLRFKLAFFGATRFDPKSDLWTRITLCQGAPLCTEIATTDPDAWAFFAPGHAA